MGGEGTGGMSLCGGRGLNSGNETHIKINKCAGLCRDSVGGKILFLCFFFAGHSLWGRKTT